MFFFFALDDSREALFFSKRSFEFQGHLQVLFPRSNDPISNPYSNLRILNLYDNDLNSLVGIGAFSQTPLEEINLGCNKLSTLPSEVNLNHAFVHLSFIVSS